MWVLNKRKNEFLTEEIHKGWNNSELGNMAKKGNVSFMVLNIFIDSCHVLCCNRSCRVM